MDSLHYIMVDSSPYAMPDHMHTTSNESHEKMELNIFWHAKLVFKMVDGVVTVDRPTTVKKSKAYRELRRKYLKHIRNIH